MSHSENKKPNPGTTAAINAGCTCPVMDNCYGEGYMGQPGVYIYTSQCPIHPILQEVLEQQEKEEDNDRTI